MKNIALALSSIAAISAAPALAETTYLAFDLGYTQLSVDNGVDIDTTSGTAGFEATSGKLTYGGEFSGTTLKNNFGFETNVSEISGYIGYNVTSALKLVAGASISEDDTSDVTSLAAGVEYTSGAFTYGAAYFANEADDVDFDGGNIFAEYNTNSLSAYVAVMFGYDDEIYLAGGSFDAQAFEIDLDMIFADDTYIYELAGTYNIRDNVRLNASVNTADYDTFDATQVTIGAGYMVADDIWVDASYNDYSNSDDVEADGFGLKVSYEMGKTRVRNADRLLTTYDFAESQPLFGIQ